MSKMQLFIPPVLYYTDEEGNFIGKPDFGKDPSDPFAGIAEREKIRYQVTQFPCTLRESHVDLLDDGSSRQVFAGESGWWEELVLAMATREKLTVRRYRLSEAILIVAHACERCMNALAWEYDVMENGQRAGYPEDSAEYRETNTRCFFCDPEMAAKAPR